MGALKTKPASSGKVMDHTSSCSIGLGLAALGRPEYINVGTNPGVKKSEEAFRINTCKVLDFAYQRGARYFDTAPSYGKGELFLMEWHQSRQHQDVILGTKWGYTYVADWQLGHQGPHEIKEHSLKKLKEQWMQSKKMLPALRLYQIHSATFESGVLDNQAVLNHLHKIKMETGVTIGITTSGPNQKDIISKAQQISVEGVELFDSFQVTFNILEQESFPILIGAKKAGKTVLIKEALANGRVFPNRKYPHYRSLNDTLTALARHYQVGIDAIALRYCMDKLNPDIVLSGASDTKQLDQNLKATAMRLSNTHISLLDDYRVSSEDYWSERGRLSWD